MLSSRFGCRQKYVYVHLVQAHTAFLGEAPKIEANLHAEPRCQGTGVAYIVPPENFKHLGAKWHS